jgi:hypothetical protein
MKAALPLLSLSLLCTLSGAQENAAVSSPPSMIKPATDGRVWGALIFATNDAAELTGGMDQAPANLPRLSERLAKVFPFKHFQILGQHQQDIFREYESWVVPSRELFMKIDSKGPAENGGVNLHLQVWREQQVLVKSDAVLKNGSPLFIGGPTWKGGRLIFILSLDRKTQN